MLKVGRAEEHLHAFNLEVERFRKSNPYRVTRHLEHDGAEHVYRVEILTEPPHYLGTIIGDFFHNLRSALDSIVYELCGPVVPDLTERELRSLGFPIAASEEEYNASPARFTTPAVQTEIEAAQPYHGEMAPYDLLYEPLWAIQEFNRIDKHRFVGVLPALAMGSFHRTPGPAFEEWHHPLGPFENGADLARFTFETPQPEVDMEFRPMLDVALRKTRLPAGRELREIIDTVTETVIPCFARFL